MVWQSELQTQDDLGRGQPEAIGRVYGRGPRAIDGGNRRAVGIQLERDGKRLAGSHALRVPARPGFDQFTKHGPLPFYRVVDRSQRDASVGHLFERDRYECDGIATNGRVGGKAQRTRSFRVSLEQLISADREHSSNRMKGFFTVTRDELRAQFECARICTDCSRLVAAKLPSRRAASIPYHDPVPTVAF